MRLAATLLSQMQNFIICEDLEEKLNFIKWFLEDVYRFW
jgi:hypothetical protein